MPFRTTLAATLALALVPAAASAHPGNRTLQQTYPAASRLCARVDAGTLPKRLAASADQLTSACTALQAAFTAAQSDFTTATTPLTQQGSDAVAQAKTACQTALAAHDRATCRQAIQTARTTLRGLRDQLRTALKAYRTAVEGARKAFWVSVHALRGTAGLAGDKPATQAPAAPALPGDGSLAGA